MDNYKILDNLLFSKRFKDDSDGDYVFWFIIGKNIFN